MIEIIKDYFMGWFNKANYLSILNYSLIHIYLIIIIVLLSLLIVSVAVVYITNMCKNNYDQLKCVLKCIDGNDKDYMNFGYWDNDKMNLGEANIEISDKLINTLSNKGGKTIDVGCGYGEQDIYWSSKYKMDIMAIDISEKQINVAKDKAGGNKINNLEFKQGSATSLPFEDDSYDKIVCLESAFHYSPRVKFFEESNRVLKDESEMVIADITIKTNMYGVRPSILINFFKRLLSIPEENLITKGDYIKQLEEVGYEVETTDITKNTFEPYFRYFYKNLKLPNAFLNFVFHFLGKTLIVPCLKDFPLEYTIYKCKKKLRKK